MDGGAESMIRNIGIELDILGPFNMLTGKSIIKNSIFQYILDNVRAKVIIPLSICKDRSLKG